MNAVGDRRSRRRARTIRLIALSAILAVSTGLGYLHVNNITTWRPAGVDALCPFGGIETLWSLISGGTLIKKIALSSVALLIASLGVVLILGRSFCGQICPLGTLQELFGRAGRALFGKSFTLPPPLDRPARYLKYVVLAVFTLLTWRTGVLVMRPYDPWATYHHLTSAELFTEFGIGALVLGIALVGSLAYDRFFCKYACPMGGLLALFSRVSVFKVRRDPETCIDCGACDTACPVNVEVATVDTVRSAECIGCSECVNACPAPGALTVATGRGTTMSPLGITTITVATFLSVIAIATVLGGFAWTQPTLAGEAAKAARVGETLDTSTIKGSTTMQEISDATGIPADELQATFGLSAGDMSAPLKEVKAVRGFSMEDVRGYVAARITGSGQ